jgi:hypothetical protein
VRAHLDAGLLEAFTDGDAVRAERLRERTDRLAGCVAADEIVDVVIEDPVEDARASVAAQCFPREMNLDLGPAPRGRRDKTFAAVTGAAAVRSALRFRTATYNQGVRWLYFVAKTEDGTVLVIARRNGPEIQILDRNGDWIDRPQMLTRFHDPGYLEEVSLAEAEDAAGLALV